MENIKTFAKGIAEIYPYADIEKDTRIEITKLFINVFGDRFNNNKHSVNAVFIDELTKMLIVSKIDLLNKLGYAK